MGTLTTTDFESLNQSAAEIRKAIKAGNPQQARNRIQALAKQTENLHAGTTALPDTEATDFVSKHMGTHGVGREELAEFQRMSDAVYIVGVAGGFIKHRRAGGGDDDAAVSVEVNPGIVGLKCFQELQHRFPKLCADGVKVAKSAMAKALYSTGANVGDEWVPTNHSPTLVDAIRLEANVAQLFRRMRMPTNPWIVPVRGALPAAVVLDEVSSDTAAVITRRDTTTKNLTLTAKKFGFSVILSEEFKEDSIIEAIPYLRDEIAQSLAHTLDRAILDGDATSPQHRDTDVDSANHASKAWDGLRETAQDLGTEYDGATFALTLLRNARAGMGTYGANPADLAYITSVSGAMRLMGLAEVKSLDVFGPNTPVLRGQITMLDGCPVVVSQDCRQNLNAAGIFDGTTTTKTIVVVVNRRSWVVGERRSPTIRAFPDARRDQDELTITARWAFSSFHVRGTEKNVATVYDIANAG